MKGHSTLMGFCRVYVVITKTTSENNTLGLRFLHGLWKGDIPHFLRRGMTEY